MFIWPSYFDDTNNDKIQPVNVLIQKINLEKFKFLTVDEYKNIFENNNVLKELMQTIYPNLPEKYARSESANVKIALNFYRIDQNN